ncbi:piggyBac transposable element-derived protein 4-like [Danio aesculapii]|uniref:piggyBac transposable element-derived protein 4-like n=1 Tax=Danio aesculapii TaxID=1142201 RepID=UPI0024BFA506|nr:piggyBac transposable element-derived protein 4-like [Danio aesculapii]
MLRSKLEETPQVDADREEESNFSSDEEEDLVFDDEEYEETEHSGDCDKDSEQIPGAKSAKTVSWCTERDADKLPKTLRFQPSRNPGPQLSSAHPLNPLSLFKLFYSKSFVSNLCNNTNAQAARALATECKYPWTDVSVEELYHYIGLIFFMNTVKMWSIADYWRQDPFFSVTFPSTVMSMDRYHAISCNLHLSDPNADENNEDTLLKVKPLMDSIRLACSAHYQPRRNLVVCERFVLSKVKPAIKANLGFRFFVLIDTSNGYTADVSVYKTNSSFPPGPGFSYDTVMSLLDPKALGSGYHVYMDDFYTTPKLMKDLFALKFGAYGMYRDQRKDFPRNKSNPLTEKSTRGSYRWIRDGPVVFVKWMDRPEVSICSTIHKAYTGERVERRVRRRGSWKTKSIPCPAPVSTYSQHIVEVDPFDQLLQYYMMHYKSMKWYKRVFLHFLDIAAANAFILHKELGGNMTNKKFMDQLIQELGSVSEEAPEQSSIQLEHLPVSGAPLESDTEKTGRQACSQCKKQDKRQLTPWKCQTCDVFLCVEVDRNCFLDWHKNIACSGL